MNKLLRNGSNISMEEINDCNVHKINQRVLVRCTSTQDRGPHMLTGKILGADIKPDGVSTEYYVETPLGNFWVAGDRIEKHKRNTETIKGHIKRRSR